MPRPTLDEMMAAVALETASGAVDFGDHASPPEFFRAALRSVSPRIVRDPSAALDAVRADGCSLSLAEAARRYRKSTHTLRAAIQAGDLRAHRVSARRYDVFPADVDAWIRANRVETARERARRAVAERG